MGLFDALLGTNTTSAQDAATAANAAMLSATGAQDDSVLRGTTTKANTALRSGATGATDALNQGYNAATGALTDYSGRAQGALASGVNNAVGTIQGGNQYFAPYATSGGAASGMLGNALGLNGPAGNDAATAAFRAAPGYDYTVQQGTDAATRAAAATGMGASGNTLRAVTTLGQHLADQGYNNWLSSLQGLAGQGLTGAAGISNNNQAAGSAQLTGGTQGAGLFSSLGQGLAGLNASQGQGLAGIQTGLGNSLSGNFTSLGQNIANTDLGIAGAVANMNTADAQAQDSAANANAGLFSKLLGGALGAQISPASLTSANGVTTLSGGQTLGGSLFNSLKSFF